MLRPLSKGEEEVLLLLSEGERIVDIARILVLSRKSVEARAWKMRDKLQARTNTHAVAIYFKAKRHAEVTAGVTY